MARILVTGCNRGIGLELCRQLATRGDHVIGVCRQSSLELEGLDVQVIGSVDVSSDAGIARIKETLGNEPIDVLLNNAGILRRDNLENLNFDEISEQFRVNSLGPLRVTHGLLDNLQEGSKVAIVTSRMGSIADNTSGRSYGYRISKAAVNMIGMTLSRDLQPLGIPVVLLHPGLVATRMTGGQGIEPQTAASGLIQRIDELDMANTGGFFHAEGYVLPW